MKRLLSLSIAIVCGCIISQVISESASAQTSSDRAKIQSYLESGEFGPALKLAKQSNTPEVRDELLSLIARAQFSAGAREASFTTAGQILGDQSRSSTLTRFAKDRLNPTPSNEGARGGGVMADFDPLIELITTTIAPDSWEDVGGPGTIAEFRSGVIVDPAGTLKRIESLKSGSHLESLRKEAGRSSGDERINTPSTLRKVSLTRLERACQMLAARGEPIPDDMRTLAGIYRIDYLFFYPETRDIVIAGPAGKWTVDEEGRKVNTETNWPVLNLDDLVVCMRNARELDGRFGCSINPRKENLLATQNFLATSKLKGEKWRDGLRNAIGFQDIVVDGIDRRTSTAQVLVEADYRMKLVGMGLEEGVAGVDSYLDLVTLDKDGNPPPMDVARWWFTMNYKGVKATDDRDAFKFVGMGVKVLSEQEKLSDEGERIHTGKTGGPTFEFADSFTTHFEDLARRYPIYAQLKNVFDFALVAGLIETEHLGKKVDWEMNYFGSPESENDLAYQVEMRKAPTEVNSVMNHRLIEVKKKSSTVKHTIVGISGGVEVDVQSVFGKEELTDEDQSMNKKHSAHQPQKLPRNNWWWD